MTDEEFLDFYRRRPSHERWELIDGVARKVPRRSLLHSMIAGQLAHSLENRFRQQRAEVFALQGPGLIIPGVCGFRARGDVAVIDNNVDLDSSWADCFRLVAELRSGGRYDDVIEQKLRFYRRNPGNLYVLVLSLGEIVVDVWSRRSDWKPSRLAGRDAVLELPELGYATPLQVIYRDTPLSKI